MRIAEAAGNVTTRTEELLTAMFIAARRAGAEEVAKWAAQELRGYEHGADVPRCRKWPARVRMTLQRLTQGARGELKGPLSSTMYLAPERLKEGEEQGILWYECRESISAIEQMVADTTGAVTERMLTAQQSDTVQTRAATRMPWRCVTCVQEFEKAKLVTAQGAVRHTVTEVCMKLEKRGVELQMVGREGQGEGQSWIPAGKRSEIITKVICEVGREIVKTLW